MPGDLDEDPGVAGDHDDEWQQEEAAEGEHVVGRLLPVGDKAPPSGALGKVCRESDGDVVENEHLPERNKNTRLAACQQMRRRKGFNAIRSGIFFSLRPHETKSI